MPATRLPAILFLLALAPRLYFAHTLALNADEAWHVAAAITSNFKNVLHPPLFFAILAPLASFSHSELALRSVNLAAGALTPPLLFLWLRRHFPVFPSLLAASIVALSPNFVLLSIQVRGYSLALLAASAALATYHSLFDPRPRRSTLLLHSAALAAGLAAEFGFAFLALSFGLAGLAELLLRRHPAPTFLRWLAVQALPSAVGLFVLFHDLLPFLRQNSLRPIDLSYVQPLLLTPGQNPLSFSILSTARLFQFLASSAAAGLLALLLALLGFLLLLRSRRLQPALVVALAFTAALSAALAGLHPIGSSRHSALIAILFVFPIAAALAHSRALVLSAAVLLPLTVSFSFQPEDFNPPLGGWSKSRFLTALERTRRMLPSNAAVLTDRESRILLRHYWAGPAAPLPILGADESFQLGAQSYFAYSWSWPPELPANHPLPARAQALLSSRPVFILDAGFSIQPSAPAGLPGIVRPILYEPGALFLAQLLPVEAPHHDLLKPR